MTFIDTAQAVNRLKEAGIPDAQAGVIVDVVVKVIIEAQEKTKPDLTPIATKLDLAEQKADLLKWIIGAIGFQTLVILSAVIALARAISP
jgi:hypothetical protein